MQYKAVINIENYAKWVKLNEEEKIKSDADITIEYKCATIATFTGTTYKNVFNNFDIKSVHNLFDTITNRLGRIKKLHEIPKKVTIGGYDFELEQDFSKLTTAQVIDIKKHGKKILDQPAYMMAVLMKPSGHEMERKEMVQLFKKEFPIELFIKLFDFFLQKSEGWKVSILILQEVRRAKLERMKRQETAHTKLQRAFISWQNFLTEMWMTFYGWLIHHIYTGRALQRNIIRKLRGTERK